MTTIITDTVSNYYYITYYFRVFIANREVEFRNGVGQNCL